MEIGAIGVNLATVVSPVEAATRQKPENVTTRNRNLEGIIALERKLKPKLAIQMNAQVNREQVKLIKQ